MLTIKAYAKINLHLNIFNKFNAQDKFHNLESIFLLIGLHDTLVFDLKLASVGAPLQIKTTLKNLGKIFVDDIAAIPNEKNIVFKAVRIFEKKTGFTFCGSINIVKRIPSGGGLGGGSSDAASTLLALNEIAGTQLSLKEMQKMAGELGSDVPFFIGAWAPNYSPAAFVSGQGKLIEYIPAPSGLYYVLVNPCFLSCTAEAYARLDEYRATKAAVSKTAAAAPSKDALLKMLSQPPSTWQFFNSFLESDAAQYAAIIDGLKNKGAEFATLCGSGSTCFGVFTDKKAARKAYRFFNRRFFNRRFFNRAGSVPYWCEFQTLQQR